MTKLPDSLAIALWLTASLLALAVFAYLLGASTEWIFPLFVMSVCAGIAEWVMRRNYR